MYIRQTTTRSKKDGSSYQSYRLVESCRVGDKVKQHTLLNLGTEFSIPRDSWVELKNWSSLFTNQKIVANDFTKFYTKK